MSRELFILSELFTEVSWNSFFVQNSKRMTCRVDWAAACCYDIRLVQDHFLFDVDIRSSSSAKNKITCPGRSRSLAKNKITCPGRSRSLAKNKIT